jgi:hypothetical protein
MILQGSIPPDMDEFRQYSGYVGWVTQLPIE